jgi:hypothetical protein
MSDLSATGTDYDVPDVTTATSNGAAVRKRLRLPLIAALALAFVSLSLISGIAYIVVLAGATTPPKLHGRPRRPRRRSADGVDQDHARRHHRPSAR